MTAYVYCPHCGGWQVGCVDPDEAWCAKWRKAGCSVRMVPDGAGTEALGERCWCGKEEEMLTLCLSCARPRPCIFEEHGMDEVHACTGYEQQGGSSAKGRKPGETLSVHRLLDLITDTSELSDDEIRAELAENGIDLEAAMERLRTRLREAGRGR